MGVPTTRDGDRAAETLRSEHLATELERGREHYAARAWARAYEAFARADAAAPLGVDDLERYAWAAGLSGHETENQQQLERLYEACVAAGDLRRAALAAFWLGFRRAALGETATAGGWLSRAQRLVESEGGDCAAAGYLLLAGVRRQVMAGDAEGAFDAAARAAEIGERCQDTDLVTFARNMQGRIRVSQGQLEAAFPFLDDAMLTASRGELSPTITGLVYCLAISACNSIYAIDRSREWTHKLARWCDEQPELVPFSSICLVHRAEVLKLGGEWSEALDEARRARESPAVRFDVGVEGDAHYEQAEIHRLRGDVALAEKGYELASRCGREPQPGLALLRLAQGKKEAALAALRRVVSATPEPLARSRFLPALVEILLAVGDLEGARAAAADLEGVAERYPTDFLGALAAQARGVIHLGERNTEAAFVSLRSAFNAWQKLDAPYEAARVRVALARACQLAGDSDGALLEQRAAREVFERLCAATDLAALDALAAGEGRQPDHPLTARELEVLRLVATGKTNKAIAKELFLSEKTVDRHVSNIFAKLDVPSRAAATAYAYAHHLV